MYMSSAGLAVVHQPPPQLQYRNQPMPVPPPPPPPPSRQPIGGAGPSQLANQVMSSEMNHAPGQQALLQYTLQVRKRRPSRLLSCIKREWNVCIAVLQAADGQLMQLVNPAQAPPPLPVPPPVPPPGAPPAPAPAPADENGQLRSQQHPPPAGGHPRQGMG